MVQQPYAESTYRDVSRLLRRLEQNILSKGVLDPDLRGLRKSTYERSRVNANIDHARALLFRLEHDDPKDSGSAGSVRANGYQQDLQDKRALVRRLQKRIEDLAHLDTAEVQSDKDTQDSENEDLVNLYVPAIPDVSNGIEAKAFGPPTTKAPEAYAAATTAAANLSSTLRSRKAAAGDALSPALASTTGSIPGDPAAMLGNITPFSPAPTTKPNEPSPVNTTNLLEAHDSEQNAITDSLLNLASALKQSTLSFSDALDSSNPLVDAAAQALDKNVTGMDAAGKRMSTLRRMTEGVGWWGRMNLFLRVGILWVVAILVGLVLPKLRF